MSFGLDYSMGMPPISDMKAAGVAFVCRYIGYTDPSLSQIKILTQAEAHALNQAGISLVSNWEWYVNRVLEGFGAGQWDAQEAQRRHVACGGPPNRPIYFSADEDYSAAQVADYFKGVSSVVGLSRTGAYGSYRVIAGLFDAGLIAWGWQTYAWSGGAWEPRAHIQQYNNAMIMSGVEVDYDRSIKSDFGQWTQGGTMVPTGWTDNGTTLTAPNGVHVVHGFRAKVLAGWDAADIPLEGEHQVAHVENYYPSDAGAIQTFRYTRLCYTAARGVYKMGIGNELLGCEKALAAMRAAVPVPTIQGIDPAKVAERLTAIGLLGKQVEQLAAQPIS